MAELATKDEIVERLALDKVFDEYDPKSQVTLDESEKLMSHVYDGSEIEIPEVDLESSGI